MEGIQYVTNEKGEKVAVQINLRKFGEWLWGIRVGDYRVVTPFMTTSRP